jgi:hypothetical protein
MENAWSRVVRQIPEAIREQSAHLCNRGIDHICDGGLHIRNDARLDYEAAKRGILRFEQSHTSGGGSLTIRPLGSRIRTNFTLQSAPRYVCSWSPRM